MLDWADSDGWRAAVYLVATAIALLSWWRSAARAARLRPVATFWLLSAAFFLAMAVARATDLGGLATELGRSEAVSGTAGTPTGAGSRPTEPASSVSAGWSPCHRPLAGAGPPSPRYPPAALAMFTLMCFIGVRLISLHQIDGLLYRRQLAGAEFGAAVELVLSPSPCS